MTGQAPLTPAELLSLLQDQRSGHRLPIFVLRTRERRVTVLSQQWRALNLVYALTQVEASSGIVQRPIRPPHGRIAVIGGGVAGVTAAAGAAVLGYDVALFERKPELLHLQRDNTTRYLHPRIYDWPDHGWDTENAQLPMFDWRAGTAADVADQILSSFSRVERVKKKTLRVHTKVDQISVEPAGYEREGTLTLYFDGHQRKFDAIILAVGFGIEDTCAGAPFSSYWRNDSHNQAVLLPDGRNKRRYLISGTGDGGLIDLFRVRLRSFRQERVVDQVFGVGRKQEAKEVGALLDWLRDVRSSAFRVGNDPAKADDYLNTEYSRLDQGRVHRDVSAGYRRICRKLGDLLRKDTEAILNGTGHAFVSARSSILHSFLAHALSQTAGSFEYRGGQISVLPQPIRTNGNPEASAESRFRTTFSKDKRSEAFDEIIIRHGATLRNDSGNIDEIALAHLIRLEAAPRSELEMQDRTSIPLAGNDETVWVIDGASPSPSLPPSRKVVLPADPQTSIVSIHRLMGRGNADWHEEFRRSVTSDERALDSSMLYYGPGLAQNWRRMTDETDIFTKLESLIVTLFRPNRDLLSSVRSQEITVVDLGIGNSDKAITVVGFYQSLPKTQRVNYIAVDISFEMLEATLDSKATAAKDRLFRLIRSKRGDVVGINCSFDQLPAYRDLLSRYSGERKRKIFLLLGNTLGNQQSDLTTLKQLAACMQAGDVLLLELQLLNPTPVSANGLTAEFRQSKALRRFFLGPFLALGCPAESLDIDVQPATERKGTRSYFVNARLKRQYFVPDCPAYPDGLRIRRGSYRVMILRKYVSDDYLGLIEEAGLRVRVDETLSQEDRRFAYVVAEKPLGQA